MLGVAARKIDSAAFVCDAFESHLNLWESLDPTGNEEKDRGFTRLRAQKREQGHREQGRAT
jgi:hypothetical protein